MSKFFKIALFSFVLFSDFVVYAQAPGDEGEGPGGVEGGDPAPAPINGKLILLLILGLTFAFYKIRNAKKVQS